MRCSSLLHYSHKTINNSSPSLHGTTIHIWMSWLYRGLVNGKHFVPFHRINVHLLVFHVPKETSPPVGLCVWHCVLKDSSGRILETGIVDVRTYDSKPTNKCICSFSQLLPVRLSPSSCCCSSIVARNSRFHLIMGIVRIYVMILFRIHPYPLPPRQRDDL